MKVLVTGGLGYVGAAVSCALVRRGHQVLSIDDLSRRSVENPAALGYTNLPVSVQSERTYTAVEEFKPDVVIHCAASAMIEEGERRRADYLTNNVVNHTQFLSHVLRAGIRKVIFSSTAAVYRPSDEPLDEGRSLGPSSWYGWTKLMAEEVLRSLVSAGELDGVIFRYFSVVGTAWGIFENRNYDEHAVTRLLRCAQTGEEFILNGDDHPTRDGSPVRDFVSLRDIALAHVTASEKLYNDELEGLAVINLGSGIGVTILELTAVVEQISQATIRIRVGPPRSGDASVMLCSYKQAERILGWNPKDHLASELGNLWRVRRGEGVR